MVTDRKPMHNKNYIAAAYSFERYQKAEKTTTETHYLKAVLKTENLTTLDNFKNC